MIEEKAIVLSSTGGFAWVETRRHSACGSCSVQHGCGTSMLARTFGNRNSRMHALNPVDARPGDQVVLGLEEQSLVKASLVVYLVPLLGLILGAVAGQLGAERLQFPWPEPLSICAALVGAAIGLFAVRRFGRNVRADRRYQPVILRTEHPEPVLVHPPRSGPGRN